MKFGLDEVVDGEALRRGGTGRGLAAGFGGARRLAAARSVVEAAAAGAAGAGAGGRRARGLDEAVEVLPLSEEASFFLTAVLL